MTRPRIGIIGARRRRQGLGPFVARDLCAAGADVTCFLATSEETRESASRVLSQEYGIEARGYLDLGAMFDRETLDALVILSPAQHHAAHLDAALRADLHVLCEKPFVWGEPELVARSSELVDAFERRGRILWENCQWPYTLSAYDALYPDARRTTPRSFEMELQPASLGVQSLADAMPHPLSLLQALTRAPAPTWRTCASPHEIRKAMS